MRTSCAKSVSEVCATCAFCAAVPLNGFVMRRLFRVFAQVFMSSVTRAQFAHLWQNHVPNVGFAVPDCPPNYCSKFSEQSVPLHLPIVVQVVWADIWFPYRLENCFLFLSDCKSMLLRHLQDVCENLGGLNRKFLC